MLTLVILNDSAEKGDVINHLRNAEKIIAAGELSVHDLKRLPPLFTRLLHINTIIHRNETSLSKHKKEFQTRLKSILNKTLTPLAAAKAFSADDFSLIHLQAGQASYRKDDVLFNIIDKFNTSLLSSVK